MRRLALVLCSLAVACSDETAPGDGADGGAADTGADVDSDGSGGNDSGGSDGGDPTDADAADATGSDTATGSDAISPLCGNAALDLGEQCDDGEANSNTDADACREDCRTARCGDHVVDTAEACDDGNALGGDGCDGVCTAEDNALEIEPNDSIRDAQLVESGEEVAASLRDGDIDCYAIEVEAPGWVSAEAYVGDDACPGNVTLQLYSANGTVRSTGTLTDAGCASIGPATAEGARYLDSGRYVVCAQGRQRVAVNSYRVRLETDNNACQAGLFPPGGGVDNDLDLIADVCDDDDDQDGYDDSDDNCPLVPNGGTPVVYGVTTSGAIRHWLLLGGFAEVGGVECMPVTPEPFDVTTNPEIGDTSGDASWFFYRATTDAMDYRTIFTPADYRSVYALAYVDSPDARSAQLRFGSDDGARVWVNGIQLFETGLCRGVTLDDDIVDIELDEGINAVLIRVRNNSGGFGMQARLTTPGGAAMTDVEIRLSPTGAAPAAQADSDGDGVGDLCDSGG
jgi:cysteine-rich repeat protein